MHYKNVALPPSIKNSKLSYIEYIYTKRRYSLSAHENEIVGI
jgi:hypothetical protein